ncbi:MAG TPA: serine/threonine-protein kinase [Candidatus Eisenbacteria bacterium]
MTPRPRSPIRPRRPAPQPPPAPQDEPAVPSAPAPPPAASPAAAESPAEALARAPEPAVPVAWGSLAILERRGEDAFGEVYLARDPELGREVTLRLRPAGASRDEKREARFLDEASRLARVRHPNVLAVLGAERREGRLGIWAERVAGLTLEEHLRRDGPLPPSEVRRTGLELCRALTAIHAAGIIHREVRTAGVVREESGRIVLMDSGSLGDLPPARPPAPGDEADAFARARAPELLTGEGVSLSSDVYGLGALLYRLVSGHDPVEAETVADLMVMTRDRRLVPLRERRPALPLDFTRVIERALDPEPARRYPNAVALERALAATLTAPLSPPAPEPAAAAAASGWMVRLERWRATASAAAALVFGLTVAALLAAKPTPSRVDPASASPPPALVAPGPAPDGPPAPPRLLARLPHAAASPAPEEPEEQWVYRPVPRTTPYGLPNHRPAPPPVAAPERGAARAVAGATEMLRALARGPAMSGEGVALADSSAFITLTTEPAGAWVTIDGVRSARVTNATFRVDPGLHWVQVEKPGYEAQVLPPLSLAPGQKLRAGVTLAAGAPDSSAAR